MNVATERKINKALDVSTLALVAIIIAGTAYVLTKFGMEGRRLTIAVKQGVESLALKEIARSFGESKDPSVNRNKISVEVVEFPYDELYEEELAQLNKRPRREHNKTPPFDVIMVDDPWLYSLVFDPRDRREDQRRLVRLNDVLIKPRDFFESTLHVSTYCPDKTKQCPDDYYGIPFVANSALFAYKAADFVNSNPPQNWAEVISASKRAESSSGRPGYVSRIGPGNSIVTDFMPMLWAYDPDSFPERSTGGIALNKAEVALNNFVGLVSRQNQGGASRDDFDVTAYLEKGSASMGIVWSAWAMMLANVDDHAAAEFLGDGARLAMPAIKSVGIPSMCPTPRDFDSNEQQKQSAASSEELKEKLVFENVPRGPNSKPIAESELGVWLLAVPFDSDQKQDAKEFIKYATSPDQLRCAAVLHENPPPRRSVLLELENVPRFARHPSLIPAISHSLEHARARPRTSCWKEIENRLGEGLEKLIAQDINVNQMLSEANNFIQPLLSEKGCRSFLLTHPPEVNDAEVGH